jgi:hypothetical protein
VGGGGPGEGQTLTLNGVTYTKGLGTNSVSDITYKLNGAYGQFMTDIGVDDKQTVNGTVQFKIYADGVKVYDSGIMNPTSATQHVALNMAGVQTLRLVVDDGDDDSDYDQADWAGARLVPAAPTAPQNLAAGVSDSTVSLSWTATAPGTVDSYNIERSTDGVTFTPLATVSGTASSYADSATTAGTTYTYRIAAINAGGTSAFSGTAQATIAAAPSPIQQPAALRSIVPTTSINPTATQLPSGWSSVDIGAAVNGTASYSDGSFLMSGAGNDIGGAADSCQFAYQQHTGDGTIIARVGNVQSNDPSAKAGLMIRAGLAAGSQEVSLVAMPNGKVSLISRAKDGAKSKTVTRKVAAPTWMKLVRSGKKVSAYVSSDGKKWKSIGAVSIAMPKTVNIGLTVTAHKPNTATTMIDRVSVI